MMIRKILFFLIILSSVTLKAQNGASTCEEAEPMCSDNNGVKIFDNVTGVSDAGEYGCLNSTPNPSWFFIKVEQSGELIFEIKQSENFDSNGNATGAPIDVDFIAWGPFGSPNGNCNNIALNCGTQVCQSNTGIIPNFYINNIDGTNIVDCSYDEATTENFTIPNAQAGEFYMLLITNYPNTSSSNPNPDPAGGRIGKIKLEQTNFGQSGAGVTDCSILVGDLGPDQTVCEGTQVDLDGEPSNPTTPIASYQWQLSTDGGTTFTDISGETNSTYSITNNISGHYQVIVTDTSGITGTSDTIEITFTPLPTATNIADLNQCESDTIVINTTTTNADTFQWQVSTDNGATFNDINADANYSNETTASLQITNLPNSFNNYQYRVSMSNTNATNCDNFSNAATLTVNPLPTATLTDSNQCENNTFTIDATNITNANTFQWQVSTDNGATFNDINADANYSNETTASLQITNLPNSFNNYQYRVSMSNTNATNCDSFSNAATLTVNPLPTATLTDSNQCENNTFTIDATNITNANTFQWQVSTDNGATFNDINADANYSNETTASLSITNVPNSFNNYQYRVSISNTNVTNCDSFSNTATLTVNPLPTATLTDSNQCENNTFTIDATNITNANTFQWQVSTDNGATFNDINADANYSNETTASLQITNLPNSFNNYQYRVSMSNTNATNCDSFSNAATLTVNPLPTATLTDSNQCENNTFTIDATNITNANTFQWQVSTDNGATFNDINADANYSNETTASLQITNLPNSFNNYQYRVSISNTNATNCDSFSNAAILTVNPLPILNTVTLRQCDNDVDGITSFNLTEANAQISTNSANESFAYFTDAAYTTPVPDDTAFTNTTPTNDIVYVRVTNTTTLCSRDISLNLLVTTTQIPTTFNITFNVCDDYIDDTNNDTDGITSFNFEFIRTQIETLFIAQNVAVTFYRNEADALAEQNEITDATNYRNIGYPNMQDIYVRVDNDLDNGCLGLGPYIHLIVDPVPTANPINTTNELEECDNLVDGDATNGIVQNWDLEALTPTILATQDPANYTVTYHETPEEADSGANPLSSPHTNTTSPNRQTIYVRVAGNGCEYDRYTFDLVVTSLPVANAINMANTHEVCDNDEDGSAINGFIQNQDLEVLTPTILGTQDPANFIVTYHTSLALAQSNGTAIISGNYTNDSNTDIVYVRIEDRTTGCVNDTFNFTFQVNPEPLGYTPSNLSLCDNDGDGDDTNGLVQTFDLENQIPDILGDSMVQDQDDFIVTFHLSPEDATSGDTPKSSPFTNTIINQQTIYVRIENKATGCINDDVSFDVIVNPLPDFQVTSPQMICLNNPPLTLVAENPNQVYAYQWFDASGNALGGSISIEVTSGGEYTVTATTTNGTNCSRTRTIIVNESNIASIEQQDVTIDDDIYIDGTTTNSITINNTDNNLGVGDYEFALLNEQEIIIRDYQDAPVFNNLEGGIYTIHVRDKNGCGVATLTVAVLEVPKFFTPNGDGYNDSWVIKGANNTFFPTNSVLVFDRLGKIITKFSFNSRGWNGRYKNNLMPSNDYWYTINITDRNGNNHSKKGHFSLIRK